MTFPPDLIPVVTGKKPSDICLQNALLFHAYTCEFEKTSLSITNGYITGIGDGIAKEYIDLKGKAVVPGFIDSHVHIESSILSPIEYGAHILSHGTTTVVADPHEIANACGKEGLYFMFDGADKAPIDICYTLPSCVPATPSDECAEILDYSMLSEFVSDPHIIGFGEMMNIPGVINANPNVISKLSLFSIRDGHAPLLRGKDLQAYVAAGLSSDHETISDLEAVEKLKNGMYLFIREGNVERNLSDLIKIVTPKVVSRCAFCTDDRSIDMLIEKGSIDDCIRKAIAAGCEPELVYRMASLSPAERYDLTDRGALVPGRIADFCILDDIERCDIREVYKNGSLYSPVDQAEVLQIPDYPFRKHVPTADEIKIPGSGRARVIGLNEHQIVTNSLEYEVSGDEIGDQMRDLLKIVVASRYTDKKVGIGIIHGLSMKKGAIAESIGHDSHHIMAAGTDDESILAAMQNVISSRGGFSCVCDDKMMTLPLPVAGLMSDKPASVVYEEMKTLLSLVSTTDAIENAFTYLSFAALTVIPEIRITPDGIFDAINFAYVPLFIDSF